jgi:hypothetical protein
MKSLRWLALLTAIVTSSPVWADDTGLAAHGLLAAWHEDPARIDRARSLLETAAVANPRPGTLVELSRAWFLTGEFRARTDAERVTAYERGSQWARQAVDAAPGSERAHFMLAINTGRLAELRGVMRALPLVARIREESDTVLRLNPTSVDGLVLAGSLASEMPPLMGGDRAKAEVLLKRGARLELARLYITTRRWHDAERELQAVVDEREPTDRPRWTIFERARAQALLAELQERGRTTGSAQSP